ncbi:MAG: hypothetical protein KAG18_05520 [Sinobacterium sp.]|nr:hypothetical protein [Sinobacterium sp.]
MADFKPTFPEDGDHNRGSLTERGLPNSANISPWQVDGLVDIQFSLLFSDEKNANKLLVFLPCQCSQGNESVRCNNVDTQLLSLTLCLASLTSAARELMTQNSPVMLKLHHQDTCVEVPGHCGAFDEANFTLKFIFDDSQSMQVRMILQLVKICQMSLEPSDDLNTSRSGLDSDSSSRDITFSAQRWSDEYAADFADKFDNKK